MIWNDSIAIYKQIEIKICDDILDDVLSEGDQIPSVANLSALLIVNPATVGKAIQHLVNRKIVTIIRGKGTYVSQGAKKIVLTEAKDIFLQQEWPKIKSTMNRLGLQWEDLTK